MEVRPHVSASLAAGFAYEPRLEIGKPDVIWPLLCADRDRVAALVIRAINQDAAHARVAHLSKGDLLWSADGGHALLKRGLPARTIRYRLGLGSRWCTNRRDSFDPDWINAIVVCHSVNERLRSLEAILDAIIGSRKTNIFVPGRNTRAPKIEAADLMLFDRCDGWRLVVPFLVVTEHNPVLG